MAMQSIVVDFSNTLEMAPTPERKIMINSNEILETTYSYNELYTMMSIASHNYQLVGYVRGELCDKLDDFFREISSSLRFPDDFGWNWDAFDDWIQDLDWFKFSGILIVINHYSLVFKNEFSQEKYRKLLIEHLQLTTQYWNEQNVPIKIILNN